MGKKRLEESSRTTLKAKEKAEKDIMMPEKESDNIFLDNPAFMVLMLAKAKGGIFRFPVYITEKMRNTPIDALDLSKRASNCVRRNMGLFEEGALANFLEKIDGSDSLKKLRGLGKTTAAEIMKMIYLYQYDALEPDRKMKYLQEVIDMNGL